MSGKTEEGSAAISKKKTCDAPQVSNDELSAFHQTHFGGAAISQFGQAFLNPAVGAQADDAQWNAEDDLGYYDDGVKRTLTDDQIDMFRHSELKDLRRKQDRAALKKARHQEEGSDEPKENFAEAPLKESTLPPRFTSTKKRKKTNYPREPKPDLRKRTWDVVDKGLDTLDYD